MKKLLTKNFPWILGGSICQAIISFAVVFGTNAIAEQFDLLLTFHSIDFTDILFWVLPAIILATLAAFAAEKLTGIYSVKVITQLQDAIVQRLPDISSSFWSQESTGRLLSKMTSDIAETEKFVSATLPDFIKAICSVLFVAVHVGRKNLFLLLITAALYPLILLIMTRFGDILKQLAKKRRGNIDRLTEQVLDCAGGIEIIKSYNLSRIFLKKIEDSIQNILDNEYKRAWIMHFSQTLQRFLFCIPNMVCPLAALCLVLDGKLTIGGMTAFLVLINKIISNMRQLPFLITDIKEKKVSLERLDQLLNAPVRTESPVKNPSADSIILENVSFRYGNGAPILKDITLRLDSHKTYAFAGESGQGKSTLFRLLCGLEDTYDGTLRLNPDCALVTQTPFLFEGTLEENIRIGKPDATLPEIMRAAKAAGIHEKIATLPEQYDTLIGENGAGLSGGEKQRICIARALLSDAKVLLLDEPTASVDPVTEKIIAYTLDTLKGAKTILLISHRLSLVKNADLIHLIADGTITEKGTHDELLQNNGAYKKLWEKEIGNEVS